MLPAASCGVSRGKSLHDEKPRFLKLFPLSGNPVASYGNRKIEFPGSRFYRHEIGRYLGAYHATKRLRIVGHITSKKVDLTFLPKIP
jgi:hypothetical protein